MPKYNEPIGEGAMWDKVSGKGNEFLSGVLEFPPTTGAAPIKVSFVAFPIEVKKTDRSPDYRIFVNSAEPAPARASRQARAQRSPAPQNDDGRLFPSQDADEDIPF